MISKLSVNEFDISVIIPTYNRGAVLQRCLEALALQTLSPDAFEVIVADDGSTDDTRNVTESFVAGRLAHVRYIWQKNSGASAARNRAIRSAKGRLLLIINDDTIAIPTMLAEHMRSHEIFPDDTYAILGKITISPDIPHSIFAKMHLDASFSSFEDGQQLNWKAFITCNISVKRAFLIQYELFEENFRVLHEDLELGERLSHHGLKIVYNSAAMSYHYHFIEEKDFLGSATREGQSLAIWYRKSPHLKEELASIGFYLAVPMPRRLRYVVADILINRCSIPFLLTIARFLSDRHDDIALKLYSKIYQSLKRRSIRNELSRNQ